VITGTNASLTKQGAGTLTLAGTNSYKLTTVSAGTLKAGSATAFGNINTGTVTVLASAAIDLNGKSMAGSIPALTLNGTGINGGGALLNSSTTAASFANTVTLGSSTSIVGDAGSISLGSTATITGSGFALTLGGAVGGSITGGIATGAGTLTKQGSGSWLLKGAGTYSGGTTINAGTIQVGNATALGTGPIAVTSGAALDLYGSSMSSTGVLTLNGTGINGAGALMNGYPTGAVASAYSGPITLGSNSTIVSGTGTNTITLSGTISGAYALTLDGVAGGSISGILAIGTGTLTKQGSGTWSLTGANTYSGTTTISAGTLQIGDSNTTSTLMGTGVVVNNSILAFNNAANQSFAPNTISGTGAVTVTGSSSGSGTVTLRADNTYSGGITVNSGPLVVVGGSSTGLAGAVTSGPFGTGTLTFGRTGRVELAGYNIANTIKSNYADTSPTISLSTGTSELSGQIDLTLTRSALTLAPASGTSLRLTGTLNTSTTDGATVIKLRQTGAGTVFEGFSSINAGYLITMESTAGAWNLASDPGNSIGLGSKASISLNGGTFDLAGNELAHGLPADRRQVTLNGGTLTNSASTASAVWAVDFNLTSNSTVSTPNCGVTLIFLRANIFTVKPLSRRSPKQALVICI